MKNLLKALDSFQNECPPVVKSALNPFFSSKFASLDTIQHHIKPYLHKNGLVITQVNIILGEQWFVQTNVWHTESGETMLSTFPIVVQKHTAQDYGSAVSYAKRYSLSGLLNIIIADEDDDGNKASDKVTIIAKKIADDVVEKPWLNEGTDEFNKVKSALQNGFKLVDVRKKYNVSKKVADLLTK